MPPDSLAQTVTDVFAQQQTLLRLLWTLLVLVAAVVLMRLGRRLVLRLSDDPTRRFQTSRLIGRVLVAVTIGGLVLIWVEEGRDILAAIILVGTGFAIALREPLLSAVGRLSIALRTTYEPGDRIEVNGVRGDVIDIRLMHTVMMEVGGWVGADQSSGRLVHIPNNWVYQHAVYNFTHGFQFIWNELSVVLTFRSDWEAAERILRTLADESAEIVAQQATQQLRDLSRELLIHYSILTPFVYVDLTQAGIRLTLRYLCDVRKRRGTAHAFTVRMLQEFRQHPDIELAYPMRGFVPYGGPSAEEPPPNRPA